MTAAPATPIRRSLDYGAAAAPPAPNDYRQPRKTNILSIWLLLLAFFLAISAVTFVLYPEAQVSRLLEHAQEQAALKGCRFPCAARHGPGKNRFWRGFCPYHCGGPWDEQDFGLAAHIVKALGTTYATLGLTTVILSLAPRGLRIAGAQCLTVWSLSQLYTSSAPFLSPEDAARRLSFHCCLIALNTLASGWAMLFER